jgi:hypothetical protein
LYFQIIPALISGPIAKLYVYNQRGYNNSSDGIVTSLGGGSVLGAGTPAKIAPIGALGSEEATW